MPVMSCSQDGKPGWKYGNSGKCYTYPAGDSAASGKAKQKAYLQGAAITGGHVEKAWSRPNLGDFTDKQWGELSASEKRHIASHFAYHASLDSFGDLKLPYKEPSGKVNLDGVRNALSRLPQTHGIPEASKNSIRAKLQALLGNGKAEKQLTTGDVHVPTSIGTSLAQRRARYRKLAEALPEEITLREGFVSGVALANSVALRLDRAPVLLRAWSELRKSAPFRLIDTVTQGEEPLYDLILRRRAVDHEPVAEGDFRILKTDAPQRKVTGVVFEPNVVDTQGDFEKPAEIEKAAHSFLSRYRMKQAHLWHSHERPLSDDEATLVENWITPVDCEIGGQAVKKGSWLQTWQLSPMLWGEVERGELTGFSFGGTGVRKTLNDAAFDQAFADVAKRLEDKPPEPKKPQTVEFRVDGTGSHSGRSLRRC